MKVLVKGAGDIATGIACRLWNAGFSVVMTEIPIPTTVRRTVAFSRAVYEGQAVVENVTAYLAETPDKVENILSQGAIAVLIDPECTILQHISFDAVVDAILAKKNLGTDKNQAPLVVGVGPGFTAQQDCHCVIETARGHDLGRVIYHGQPKPNSGIPGEIAGYTIERILRAPCSGIFHPTVEIGDIVKKDTVVAWVEGKPVQAQLTGVVRGLLQDGVAVVEGMKSGDIDPRSKSEFCYSISDKARAIGGGVLEALCHARNKEAGK